MDYFAWKRASSTCTCGWSGVNTEIVDFETFSELFEYFCPSCERKLGLVDHPTYDDIVEAAAAGDAEAKQMLADIDGSESRND